MQSWHKKCARTQASSRPDELEASNELRVKWLAAPIKRTRKMIDTCSWNLANYGLSPGTSKHLAALASTSKHCTASTSPHLTPPHLTSLHLTCQHLATPHLIATTLTKPPIEQEFTGNRKFHNYGDFAPLALDSQVVPHPGVLLKKF